MTLDLTDVKIASNQLTSNGTWYPVQGGESTETDPVLGEYTLMRHAFHMVTDNALLGQVIPILEPIAGKPDSAGLSMKSLSIRMEISQPATPPCRKAKLLET